MALPIVFNNQTYNTNFLSQDNDGIQNNIFENDDNNPQPYTLNGTVNAVGDPVVFTSSNGSDQFTAYATNLDNPNQIVFSDNADGSGIAIIASNTQLVEGGTETFSETNLGDYIPVCFVTGTQIRTERGEIAVEDLQFDDLAVTASGEHRPISWVGHRTVDCVRHSNPAQVQPVRIRAHALGTNKPACDLLVSPGHAICLNVLGEVLIPASALINGSTITQEQVEEVTYWHVELDSHDILIANGQPAESYLDVGNRSFFAGANVFDPFTLPDARLVAEPAYCRPCFSSGALVQVVHTRMRERALALGWSLVEEPLAGLHLVADGRVIQPDSEGLVVRFIVPADAQDVRLVSSSSVPKDVGENDDGRTLGVCLESMMIDDGVATRHEVALNDSCLSIGFHEAEEAHRWTDGEAHVPRELWAGCRGHFFLRIDLARPALPRWAAPEAKVEIAEPQRHGLQLMKAA
ncbi:Hint domain-containing protein [Methylorubrum extorquens]|uniref:Hint domain-containing protein n=1 Tax=Methylorubrum extorquens TaxID=408 RepID=UPI002237C49E|nr:Hint domain-containing protein [Methylorubrum extorquens]UYW24867.1 Hint domain-containing protein [Methylorubrum extorquens]